MRREITLKTNKKQSGILARHTVASQLAEIRVLAVGVRTGLELFLLPTNYTNYGASYRWLSSSTDAHGCSRMSE